MKKSIAGAIHLGVLVFVGLSVAGPAWSQGADTVLINGKILTVDDQFSTREAVAVREGKIVALGSSAQIRKLAGPQSRVIDLQGRTVLAFGFLQGALRLQSGRPLNPLLRAARRHCAPARPPFL